MGHCVTFELAQKLLGGMGEEAGHLGRGQIIKGLICHEKELNVICWP